MLVGEGAMRDHAVGEKVDLVSGESSQVRIDVENYAPPKNREHDYRITVTNANPHPADVELGFDVDDSDRHDSPLRNLPRRNGLLNWLVRLPATRRKTVHHRVTACEGTGSIHPATHHPTPCQATGTPPH